jgi:hypothetical protein
LAALLSEFNLKGKLVLFNEIGNAYSSELSLLFDNNFHLNNRLVFPILAD